MPYQISTFTLPCGTRAARANAVGHIVKEDVHYLVEQSGPGGPIFMLPMLVTTHELKSLSTEARAMFGNNVVSDREAPWCATVVTNPVIRVAINFMMRVNRTSMVRLFGTEEDAIRWLDERARQDMASKG
jgi:hypothetical protein